MKKPQKFFALWGYDLFPYTLGGTITEMTDKGNVETVEYGPGKYFRPYKIMPLKAGKELMNKLSSLRDEYRKAKIAFEKEWTEKANQLKSE